jgi:Competence protein CoiA-like family
MNAPSDLLLPYGCPVSGPLVRVEDARHGTRYTCPHCGVKLVLKDGAAHRRRKHFAHPSTGACSQESIYHATAKRLIADVIREHAAGRGDGISLRWNCHSCNAAIDYAIPRDAFTDAAEEHSIDGYRCDVVGLNGSEVRLAIEIMHTHATTDAKAAALSVKMIELDAGTVLSDPCLWVPIRNTLKPRECAECKSRPASAKAEPSFVPTPQPSKRKAKAPLKPVFMPNFKVVEMPDHTPAPKAATKPASKSAEVPRPLGITYVSLRPPVDLLEQILRGGGRGYRQRQRKRL